jgi:hypothetical protein
MCRKPLINNQVLIPKTEHEYDRFMSSKFFLSIFLLSFSLTGFAGNGAPDGTHYNLNIIGVPKTKSVEMSGNQGHRIFMPLNTKAKILLNQGPDFQVLDPNGTDGAAKFQLPNPDPENDGVTAYSVYARALGKPGGSASLSTCAIDPVTMEEVCSLQSIVMVRNEGGSKFENVSGELLYVYADLDGDGNIERMSLFDDRLQDYFWSYDNRGLKILQLRFYQISTDVN